MIHGVLSSVVQKVVSEWLGWVVDLGLNKLAYSVFGSV